jgi:glutamate carboxypeptidase
VPTIISSGEALNVVPDAGELVLDMRADRLEAFEPVLEAVPIERDDVRLEPVVLRRWPGMDSRERVGQVLAAAGRRLGRPIIASGRGGASDASHFASSIPITIDGLGPRGGGAHTAEEFVLRDSLRTRAEVALAVAETVLEEAA